MKQKHRKTSSKKNRILVPVWKNNNSIFHSEGWWEDTIIDLNSITDFKSKKHDPSPAGTGFHPDKDYVLVMTDIVINDSLLTGKSYDWYEVSEKTARKLKKLLKVPKFDNLIENARH